MPLHTLELHTLFFNVIHKIESQSGCVEQDTFTPLGSICSLREGVGVRGGMEFPGDLLALPSPCFRHKQDIPAAGAEPSQKLLQRAERGRWAGRGTESVWDELLSEGRRAGEFQVARRQSGPRRRQMGTPWQGLCRGGEGVAGGKEANTDTEI